MSHDAEYRGRQIAESVCPGHPDKLADQVSDAVLDAHLAQDPGARVNCEVLATRDTVVATGQITANADVDVDAVVRRVIEEAGYTDPRRHGLSAATAEVQVRLDRQAREIADGVDRGGAGDSGIVYGYATDQTPERMPLACVLAHDIARRLTATAAGPGPRLGPDGKVQVEIAEAGGGQHATVVVSTQHGPEAELADVVKAVTGDIVEPALRDRGVTAARIHVNPAGTFVIGGTAADAGLTGRKLMVDSYGGLVRHGGGCWSGKDATKVDRSGAYLARYLAVNVVAAGLAPSCRIGLGYAIGRPEPVWFAVDCFGESVYGRTVPEREIIDALRSLVDLSVEATLARLNLRHTPFRPTATFGHYGRTDVDFPWERADLTDALRALC